MTYTIEHNTLEIILKLTTNLSLFDSLYQAGGFGLLVLGPSYIPANEVSLFFLIETILGNSRSILIDDNCI